MFVNRPGRKKEGYMSKSGEKEPLENLKEQFSSFFGKEGQFGVLPVHAISNV